jgi:hypothetical protein
MALLLVIQFEISTANFVPQAGHFITQQKLLYLSDGENGSTKG